MNRIKRLLDPDSPPGGEDILADLYAGDGQYVTVEMSTESTLLTVRWRDSDESHWVIYSMAVGAVLMNRSAPLQSGN